jgi:hypothetical protein
MGDLFKAKKRANKALYSNREKVWVSAWNATASSSNCLTSDSCDKFADKCLKSYDERFET